MTDLDLLDFPQKSYEKLRYRDTDRQGHINNAVFSTFLETGRVEVLYNSNSVLHAENASFVIVSLKLDFINEISWPGKIDIGTGILRIGNSSIRFFQKLFQDGETVAKAETVIVQIDNHTKQSTPLTAEAKEALSAYLLQIDDA